MPSLALLASAGLRRVAALVERFGGAPVGRVKMPDLRAARVVEDSFGAWSGRRYAKRQGRVVPLEGASGHAVVRGIEEAAPLLHALAVTNVGKATSMGFGWLSVEPA
jgi:CRISPR/Cas system endoribonuclease Cas6 (RAMP superfamily)